MRWHFALAIDIPRFHSLKRMTLVVTCAPSLKHCYVFEISTLHKMVDFEKFETDGQEAIRRWYKFNWEEASLSVSKKIIASLEDIVSTHLESVRKQLSANSDK